jgi:hypothetical protein
MDKSKKYLSMLIIGMVLCILACVNLLLKNNYIITFIQIVFGIPFVAIGIKNVKNKL